MLRANLKWAKKNLPRDLKIWKELISEVDWKEAGRSTLENLKATKDRIVEDVKAVAAMTPEERKDSLTVKSTWASSIVKDRWPLSAGSGGAWRARRGIS